MRGRACLWDRERERGRQGRERKRERQTERGTDRERGSAHARVKQRQKDRESGTMRGGWGWERTDRQTNQFSPVPKPIRYSLRHDGRFSRDIYLFFQPFLLEAIVSNSGTGRRVDRPTERTTVRHSMTTHMRTTVTPDAPPRGMCVGSLTM